MTDEIFFDGAKYISAQEAASSSDLTRDYISRLCRDRKVKGRRIGKNWYVSEPSFRQFLMQREYAASERSQTLVENRIREYKTANAPSDELHTNLPSSEGIKVQLAQALAASEQSPITRLLHAPSGIGTAALSAAHVPVYALTPAMDLAHKLIALTLAFTLIFGAFALVDPSYAQYAADSAHDEVHTLADAASHIDAPQIMHSAPVEFTAAAVDSSNLFGSILGSALAVASNWNSSLNTLAAQIVLPQSALRSLGLTQGNESGTVAVQVAPYQVPIALPTFVASTQSTRAAPPQTPQYPQTIINNPVIERVVQTVQTLPAGGISENLLDQKLNQLDNSLTEKIYSLTSANSTAVTQTYNVVSQTNAIDQLTSTDIKTPTITGGSISGTSVSATDLSVSGGTSLSGDVSIKGSLSIASSSVLSTGSFLATNATSTNFFATNASTTNATSTTLFAVRSNLTTGIVGNLSAPIASITGLTATNATTTNATSTNFYSTNLEFVNSSSTNATSTNLFAVTASSTNFYSTNANLGALAAGTLSLTAGTSTNFFASLASSTNLYSTNANLGTVLLGDATSTHLFATTASSTNLFAQNATLGTLNLNSLASTGNGYFGGGLGVGIATTSSGVLQTSGMAWIGGDLLVTGNSTVLGDSTTIGNSSAGNLVINSSIKSNIIPNQNITYDLGSPSFYWRNAYVGNLNVNNISAASTTISGTASNSFTISSANATADTQDEQLIFFRGSVVPNALLSWNAATSLKRFEFNQPLFIQNGSASTTEPTLVLQSVAGQTANIFNVASSSGAILASVGPDGSLTSDGTLALNGTSGTSTIASGQGFSIGSSQFVVQQGSGSVGIGTASPGALLDVSGAYPVQARLPDGSVLYTQGPGIAFHDYSTSGLGADGQNLSLWVNGVLALDLTDRSLSQFRVPSDYGFSWASGTTNNTGADTGISRLSADVVGVGNGTPGNSAGTLIVGTVGIGTTTPGSLLSLNGIANFTTATSTFYGSGGINLAAGCFSILGNCLSLSTIAGTLATNQGGLGTTTWQTNSVPYFNGTYFTENNAAFNFNGTKLTTTYASTTALTVSGLSTLGGITQDGTGGTTYIGDPLIGGNTYVVNSLIATLNTSGVTYPGGNIGNGCVVNSDSANGVICDYGSVSANVPGDYSYGGVFAGSQGVSGANSHGLLALGTSLTGATSGETEGAFLSIDSNSVPTTTAYTEAVEVAAYNSTQTAQYGLEFYNANPIVGGVRTLPAFQTALGFNVSGGPLATYAFIADNRSSGETTRETVPYGINWSNTNFSTAEYQGPSFMIGPTVTNYNSEIEVTGSATSSPGITVVGAGTSSPATNANLTLSALGTGAVVMNSSVGIGTTTPTANLSVQNNYGSTNATLFSIASSTNSGGSVATNFFTVSSAGLTNLLNLSAGNATTTNLFSTTASSTNLFAQTASLGSLALSSPLAALSGGLGTTTWQTNSVPYFNGTYFTENNAAFNFNGTKLTTTYASTTALTASGTGYFGNGAFTSTTGTTTIASGQGFTIGGSQFVVQQGSGNVGIGTTSPTQALSVQGNGLFSGNLAAANITATGTVTLSGITNALLSTNGSGAIVATSSIGTNLLTGVLSVGQGGTGSTTLGGLLTGNGTGSLTAATVQGPLSFSGDTLSITQATASTNGYLSSTDWNTFNKKLGSSTISSLATDYLLKWNGSAFQNSLVYDNGTSVDIGSTTAALSLLNITNTATSSPVLTFYDTTGAPSLQLYAGTSTLDNTAIGLGALINDTTGYNNSAVGISVLAANTTGEEDNAIGAGALTSNTTGCCNNAIGGGALSRNTTGSDNTGLGDATLFGNSTGSFNTAVGNLALTSNTTSFYNSALGNEALGSNTTGSNNTALGDYALWYNTTGSYNVGLGDSAGNSTIGFYANVTGSKNVFIGYQSGPSSSAEVDNAIAIGNNAVVGVSNTAVIGDTNLTDVYFGSVTPVAVLHSAGAIISGKVITAGLSTLTGGFLSQASSTIGNGTQAGGLTISGGATTTGNAYFGGNVGIGTTTPGSLLSLNGIANFTTATSTFYGSGGINLAAGCFSILGNCLSLSTIAGTLATNQGGLGTTTWQTNSVPYFNGTYFTENNAAFNFNGTKLTTTYASTTALTASGTGYFGNGAFTSTTGTTTIASGQGFTIGGSQFVVQQGSGNVGIGTTTPGSLFSVQNSANFTTSTTTFYTDLNFASSSQKLLVNGTPVISFPGWANTVPANNNGVYTIVGWNAGVGVIPTSLSSTIIGNCAGGSGCNTGDGFGGGTGLSGQESTFVGNLAGTQVTTGNWLTCVGHNACGHETTGQQSVWIGTDAGKYATSTNSFTAVGVNAGKFVEQSSWSVLMGMNAGQGCNNGSTPCTSSSKLSRDVFIGYNVAGGASMGSPNRDVVIGDTAQGATFSANDLVLIGSTAGNSITNGGSQVIIGSNAGSSITSGNTNTIIGNNVAQTTLQSGTNNILIGTNSGVDTAAAGTSNTLNIGNLIFGTGLSGNSSISGNIGIGTSSPLTTLSIQGAAGANDVLNVASSTGASLLYVNSNGRVGLGTASPGAVLHIEQSTSTPIGLIIGGKGSIANSGQDLTNGVALLTGVNQPGDRQLWIGPSEDVGSASLGFFRYETGNTLPSIDGVTGDGLTRLNLNLGTYTTNVGVGISDALSGTQPGSKLSVAGGLAVGLTYYAKAAPTSGAIIEGNVGIGTSSPLTTLSIQGAAGANDVLNVASSTGASMLYVNAAGNIGIGTASPAYPLDVNGFINDTSGYDQSGNTILYANAGSNSQSLALDSPSAAAWMAATTSPYYDFAVGLDALSVTPTNNVGYTSSINAAIGNNTLQNNTTGNFNLAVGNQALQENTTGSSNTGIGGQALWLNTTGYSNTAIGYGANSRNLTGYQNTSIGQSSIGSNTTGAENVAIGTSADLWNDSATDTVAIGANAGAGTTYFNNQGGTYVGTAAGYNNTTGSDYNTLFGFQSGYSLTTGADNLLMGAANIAASYNQVTTGSNNISIGYDVALASSTASNQLDIGNEIYGTGLSGTGSTVSTGNIGIGTTTPISTLTVVGSGCFGGTSGVTVLCGTTPGDIYYRAAITGNYDVAENYVSFDKTLAPGEIVAVDSSASTTVKRAQSGDTILGVVSTSPGLLLGGADPATSTRKAFPIALSGRVPVKVSLENGPIAPGDRLALSATTPGVAVKATESGWTVGVALDSYSASTPNASSTVMAFVDRQYYFAPDTLAAITAISTSTTASSSSTTSGPLAGLFSQITQWLASAANGIQDLYASIIHSNEIDTQKLCVGDTCVTQAEFLAMVQAVASSSSSSTATASSTSTVSTTTPPQISINGNNPATINIGDTYADLGSTVTGPHQDLNLGIHVSVDGGATTTPDQIVINTSVAGTHSIVYSATDQNGLVGYATRTVDVVAASTSSTTSTSTTTTAATSTATSTTP